MLNKALRSIALAAALLLPASLLQAQDRMVTGTVTDSGGRPIAYVNIDGGPRYRTVSNAVGEWSMKVPAKEKLEVAVRRIGFLPTKFRLEAGSDTTINSSLQQLAVLMNTQVIR